MNLFLIQLFTQIGYTFNETPYLNKQLVDTASFLNLFYCCYNPADMKGDYWDYIVCFDL